MSTAITYIIAHWADIVTAASGVVIAARVIVKLTPTPRDDSVLESIVTTLKHLGLHIGSDK
jgi:hypothetical protein